MKLLRLAILLMAGFLFTAGVNAQVRTRTADKSAPKPVSAHLKSSAAFGELMLRRAELESSLEEMLVSYTEEYPKVKETRYELNSLSKDMKRLNLVKAEEKEKLTVALGKLIVRKAELSTNYWVLLNRFSEEHPQAKRAKKKLEIFSKAVDQIL